MSISLNNVNSEVVRAHKRIDEFTGSSIRMVNYFNKKSFSANTTNYTDKDYYVFIKGYGGCVLTISDKSDMSNILLNSGKIGGTTSYCFVIIPKGFYFKVTNGSDFGCIGYELK